MILKKKLTYKGQSYLAGYLFIALPIIGFLLFTLLPLVFSLFVSFNNYDFFTGEFTYIGFNNYASAFKDPFFISSLQNTGLTLIGLVVQVVVSLLLALLLTVNIKGQPIFRSFFFIPSLCSSVAVTLVWKWMFNGDFGILNSILTALGLPAVGWLTDIRVAIFSMILQGVWMGVGGGMVMYIAALKNTPQALYEAAEMDGASTIQKFFNIILYCG